VPRYMVGGGAPIRFRMFENRTPKLLETARVCPFGAVIFPDLSWP
jgi:hypothetical protein